MRHLGPRHAIRTRRVSPKRVTIPAMQTSSTPPTQPGRSFGPAATLLWVVCIMLLFVFIQTLVVAFYVASNNPGATGDELAGIAQALEYNGTLLAVSVIATALVCSGVIWNITNRRLKDQAASYLGLQGFQPNQAIYWMLWLGALLFLIDLIAIVSGRPQVPEFMQLAYDSADSKWLLWFALVVAAPIFEELLFRGFLFQGLRQTALGASGSILICATFWAIIHQQYDWFGLLSVFVIGLILGLARWRSQSLLLTIILHSATNLVALMQLLLLR